jgi:hypothetical protein
VKVGHLQEVLELDDGDAVVAVGRRHDLEPIQ